MDEELGPILFLVVLAVLAGAAVVSARRFAARRKREGLWNEKGPIDPSLPPTDFLQVYPQPWGIQRPVIESAEAENPYRYPQGKDSDGSPEHREDFE